MIKRISLFIFIFFTLVLLPAISQAVIVEGGGISGADALNNAFRQAVEETAGTFIASRTVVESGELIKDEIAAHAIGYVTSYDVLDEKKESDGTYYIKIDAAVDNGLINEHIEALEILMAMTGHPKVIVFGLDDDMHSISTIIDEFAPLKKTVTQVFHDKFRFDVLEWETLRKKYPDVVGKLDRKESIAFARRVGAELAVMVKLNAKPEKDGIEGALILEAVRLPDAFFLGKEIATFKTSGLPEKENERIVLTINQAREKVFGISVTLARKMVEGLQRETESQKGLRYSITFIDFPKEEAALFFKEKVSVLSGHVQHKVEKDTGKQLIVSYWSLLPGDDLFRQIKTALDEKGCKYKSKLEGRSLKFKWVNPYFE
ncbi:hypothetical protein [uncultured Desulfobacter sp.]|uniref:hypothetical protein n=1 Tax=uncultured Desulfobacter sp. TaxID=240139 RepID=UPI002AABAF28|nr:hypothetical protein [uncultured Desulfobacter sp.]